VRVGCLRKDGLGATNHFETCGFIRSRPGVPYPISSTLPAHGGCLRWLDLAQEHGFQAHVGPMRTKSRGWVRLASTNPREKPRILFNYLSHPDDRTEMRACVRLTVRSSRSRAFDRYRGREIQPGKDVQSDDEIDAFIRAKVESAYHPSCSCKMGGAQDAMAVVDPETRVYGLEGLRVVDSSIMPSVTTGNLNAPTIMLPKRPRTISSARPCWLRRTRRIMSHRSGEWRRDSKVAKSIGYIVILMEVDGMGLTQ